MMIIDCCADFHGHYPVLEGGDLLILAGDYTKHDIMIEHHEFLCWIQDQKYKKIVFIAGNHDHWMQNNITQWYCKVKPDGIGNFNYYCDIEYLCDSGTEFEYEERDPVDDGRVTYDVHWTNKKKLKIWGSPWTLEFEGMNPACKAFTGDEDLLASKFKMIPDDIDILVTHSPPYKILDEIHDWRYCENKSVGSKELSKQIERVRPLVHVFGHIHEGYGQVDDYFECCHGMTRRIKYINCSHVDEDYIAANVSIRIVL
jgi:predicted phosphohydrolase